MEKSKEPQNYRGQKKIRYVVLISIFVLSLSLLLFRTSLRGHSSNIHITDAKMAIEIDDKLMPVKVANAFPNGTRKVFCWFKWEGAKVNTEITAKWHYVTDDIHILDYNFTIPRKNGQGGVSLTMPEGKALPEGAYKINLTIGKRPLKSLTFKVE